MIEADLDMIDLDPPRGHPPPHAARFLEQDHRVPRLTKLLRASKTGEAGADHGDPHGLFLRVSMPIFNGMEQLLVWYDGGCPLCRREIALIRRLDRARSIQFEDVSVGDVSCPVDRHSLLARFHARENGQILEGAAAFAAMWRAIPLLRPLGLLAQNPRVLSLLDRLYTRFLRVRPILQRLFR